MKSFLCSLIIISVGCVGAVAQTNEISPCPTISVNGQAGIPSPDEPYIFTANLNATLLICDDCATVKF